MKEEEVKFVDEQGNPVDVPVDGSLGLLAMGYLGLKAWRQKRKEEGVDMAEIRKEEYKEHQEKVNARKEEREKQQELSKKQEREKKDNGETDS